MVHQRRYEKAGLASATGAAYTGKRGLWSPSVPRRGGRKEAASKDRPHSAPNSIVLSNAVTAPEQPDQQPQPAGAGGGGGGGGGAHRGSASQASHHTATARERDRAQNDVSSVTKIESRLGIVKKNRRSNSSSGSMLGLNCLSDGGDAADQRLGGSGGKGDYVARPTHDSPREPPSIDESVVWNSALCVTLTRLVETACVHERDQGSHPSQHERSRFGTV